MDKERTVYVGEMLRYILLRWRSFLICMIIFAIIAGGYGAVRAHLTSSALRQGQEEVDYSQYKETLTDREIQEVEDAVDNYITFENNYNSYKAYMTNSIKMQIDANAVPTKKIVYRIDGTREASSISDAYVETFPDEAVCQEVIRKLSIDTETAYIRELISVVNSHADAIMIDGQQAISSVENEEENGKSVLISVEIIADTRNHCEAMGTIIENELTEVTTVLQNKFGAFDFDKISDYYCEEANKELLKDQQTTISEMNNINTLINNLGNNLTEDQKSFYSVLLHDKLEEVEEGDKIAPDISEENINKVDYLDFRLIILGAFVGLIVFGCYMVCKFLVDPKLISRSYIETDLKVPLLEVFYEDEKTKKFGNIIDKKINYFFLKEKNSGDDLQARINMLCANIKVLMQRKGIERIFITSTVKTNKIEKILEYLKENFNENEIDFLIGGSILQDSISLKNFSQEKGVIFLEEIGVSFNKDIYQENMLCRDYDVNNLGFIIID